ncbi:MAG: peptidase M17 [Flavobacteriales bacterium]|nr:peptidase M17 [Flavobacteriales bacterium]MCB9166981.1 peptidase M17 [Flavobacteriales bacterium]
MATILNSAGRRSAQLQAVLKDAELVLALAEGALLGGYRFRKYKTSGTGPTLGSLKVVGTVVDIKAVQELNDVVMAVCAARDLVNEPVSFLNATQLSAEIRTLARNTPGLKVQVLDKAQIEALGMGGLLAVNKGSLDPPTFNILEYKPRRAVNEAPLVLIGKGVVYDTGGLSLKPTPHSMDYMKCDMAGGAAVIGAIAAAAQQDLPLHLVALVPATDNRPGGNAFAPGDVVRMHNGLTVEVMNSDAEGRMILADALSYAERYGPELVITVATLTGAAARAIGQQGIVGMGTADERTMRSLVNAGERVHERIALFPFWEEYDKELESEIADMKNLGGDSAGMITAGKFLARFTRRPYFHLDIAGPAYLMRADGYRPQGGTGVGVRLLYRFLRDRAGR